MVRKPLAWLKLTDAPPRMFTTPDTVYPPSRTFTVLPDDGLVTTWTYCRFSFPFVTVVYPYAPLPKLPPGMPPYMYPPPSTPCTDSQICPMYPLKKLLKLAWLDGNFPLT